MNGGASNRNAFKDWTKSLVKDLTPLVTDEDFLWVPKQNGQPQENLNDENNQAVDDDDEEAVDDDEEAPESAIKRQIIEMASQFDQITSEINQEIGYNLSSYENQCSDLENKI